MITRNHSDCYGYIHNSQETLILRQRGEYTLVGETRK